MSIRSFAVLSFTLALAISADAGAQEFPWTVEEYDLPNGLHVILHPDSATTRVVVNTWYAVGSRHEVPGRTGFAHLFEHLMFMGSKNAPGNLFDAVMEQHGGWNNATTDHDRTNYFDIGPSPILPVLLWLEADRLDTLSNVMTLDKVDLQRDVVRNERRQSYENRPYGMADLVLNGHFFPKGHPYHWPVIGSHEDLVAATAEDVIQFFKTWYVPANASLVIAGQFDPTVAKNLVAHFYGSISTSPRPSPPPANPMTWPPSYEPISLEDQVPAQRLSWIFRSPVFFSDGDAAMDMAAHLLGGGKSSRLFRSLVVDQKLAQSVDVSQLSLDLDSMFYVEVTLTEGADLQRVESLLESELDRFCAQGPSPAELQRVQASLEAQFLRSMEDVVSRADRLNNYWNHFGKAHSFDRDIQRYRSATTNSVQKHFCDVRKGPHLSIVVSPTTQPQ